MNGDIVRFTGRPLLEDVSNPRYDLHIRPVCQIDHVMGVKMSFVPPDLIDGQADMRCSLPVTRATLQRLPEMSRLLLDEVLSPQPRICPSEHVSSGALE